MNLINIVIRISIKQILKQVGEFGVPLVEVTGGEPLLQDDMPGLVSQLIQSEYTVLVETNGSLPIDLIIPPAIRIVDIKCPGSGQADHMDWKNIDRLRDGDEIKFVISDRHDFDFAISTIQEYPDLMKFPIHLSPNTGALSADELAQWILDIRLSVRLQVQLHKILKLKWL